MSEYERIEKGRAAREARTAVGINARSSRADHIDAALLRYLAAEEYHEKIEEIGAAAPEIDEDTSR